MPSQPYPATSLLDLQKVHNMKRHDVLKHRRAHI
jgi:hypothetical protein